MRILVFLAAICLVAAPSHAQAPKKAPSANRQPAAKQPPSANRPAQPAADAAPAAPAGDVAAKASYAIGFQIGSEYKANGVPLEVQPLVKGIQDALAGADPAFTEAEIREAMQAFSRQVEGRRAEMQAKQAEEDKAIGEKNKTAGAAFLAANAKQPGVKQTKSGLQYKVLKEGTGKSPTLNDVVKAHYRGTLIDGTQFDSSYDREEPAIFEVMGVIPGWTEALQMMKVGSKYQLFIPSELAYGARRRGNVISPNSALIFEIELLGVEEQVQAPGQQ